MLIANVPDTKLLAHLTSGKMAQQIAISFIYAYIFVLINTYLYEYLVSTPLGELVFQTVCRVLYFKSFSSERDADREITKVPVCIVLAKCQLLHGTKLLLRGEKKNSKDCLEKPCRRF